MPFKQQLVAAFLLLQATFAGAAPDAQQLNLAEKALQEARAGRLAAAQELEQRLGKDFPLGGYLDYHRMRARLGSAPVEEVLAWLRRYDDLPLAITLRGQAMETYGLRRNWAALRAVSQGVPSQIHLRCYYYQALLTEDPAHAVRGGQSLWLSGQSRPDSCDPLFDKLRAQGHIDDNLIQERMLLAFRAENPGLMRYLRGELKSARAQQRADTLLRLYRQPEEVRFLVPVKHDAQLVLAGLHRLADRDPVFARKLTPLMAKRYQLDPADEHAVLSQVAWFSTIRDLKANREWLDEFLAQSDSLRLLEQRARAAVRAEDWPGLIAWIERMPAEERDGAHWRYWRARALEATKQEDEAQRHFSLAARERSFWGFLAAQYLQLPYALNDVNPVRKPAPLSERHERALARIEWLQAMNEPGLAREEWLFQLRHSEEHEQDSLAAAALARGWHHFAVETALFSGRRNVLDWRFPAALKDRFEHAAADTGVDPWLLMAVARRESAFNPHARSSVGARGLMQLMPYTARQVARELGESAPSESTLLQPDTNIRLGSTYLAGLLKRYNGNRVLALAAYNAGPHRVDKWLTDAQMPYDVFIESIPFYETREYVQAVLAYRVILSRHAPHEQLASLMLPHERTRVYSPVMLAKRDD